MSISAPQPIEFRRGSDVQFIDVDDPETVHEPLVQTIVNEWNGSGHCLSTGESALRTAEVMNTLLADVRPMGG